MMAFRGLRLGKQFCGSRPSPLPLSGSHWNGCVDVTSDKDALSSPAYIPAMEKSEGRTWL